MVPRLRALAPLAVLTLAAGLTGSHPAARQVTPLPIDAGATGLGLALRQLPVEGRVLYVTAHPDDENNGVLVAFSRGRGLKTSLLTVTRGDGGQNEIGPELFQAIGILRGEELMAVHKFDGVAQYHTRAYEFGYSFSVEETLEKWGKAAIMADIVRVIRRVRPDVILTMNSQGGGGGQHHQTTARLAHEAFRLAADPAQFPEQLREGLRPWQAQRVYQAGSGPGFSATGAAVPAGGVRIDTGVFDPLLGMTWEQFGQLARTNHKCQGTSQLEAFPADTAGIYTLVDSQPTAPGSVRDPFDGIDTSLGRLATIAAGQAGAPPTLAADLAGIQASADAALAFFDARAPQKSVAPVAEGVSRVRALRATVRNSGLSANAKAELDDRLGRKEQDFLTALRLAAGVELRVTSADGDVVRGQTFTVTAQVFNTGAQPVPVDALTLNVPAGWTVARTSGAAAPVAPRGTLSLAFAVTVGPDARDSQPYWRLPADVGTGPGKDRYDIDVPADQTLPWSPPDVTATLDYHAGGVAATTAAPAYYRYDGRWVGGEKQKVVNVVPALSVSLSPDIAVVPAVQAGQRKEFRVAVQNLEPTGGPVDVTLAVPAGWTVSPATARLTFSTENESMSARFFVTPPTRPATGAVSIGAVATREGRTFRQTMQVIAYSHIQERHLLRPAVSTVQVIDVRVPRGLRVGYIMGAGDETAAAIAQLGATVDLLTPSDVAFGDLSRYTTLVLGIRAYESRADVRGYHQRLLDFVRDGGHLVVQYNKNGMNQPGGGAGGASAGGFSGMAMSGRGAPTSSPYVPYPGLITSNRVTVEQAPVRILQPAHPLLTSPNRITGADFDGWVQERGLYFFGAADPRYTELLSSADPWPYNPGDKVGLLTTTTVGRGTWTYVGLGLWRQLPAGTPGAYRLLANLIGQPRAGAGTVKKGM